MPRLMPPVGEHRQQGFGLVEILVTVFVVAVGLLAAAALQLASKRSNYDSVQRTTASALAQDIIERMRANSSARDAYLVDGTSGISEPTPNCLSSTCTAAQMASFDLWQWGQALQGASETQGGENTGGLESPYGCISSGSSCGSYTIAIAWRGVSPLPEPDGSTPSGDPSLNSCGASSGLFDDPQTPSSDYRMRRILVIDAFVSDPLNGCP